MQSNNSIMNSNNLYKNNDNWLQYSNFIEVLQLLSKNRKN